MPSYKFNSLPVTVKGRKTKKGYTYTTRKKGIIAPGPVNRGRQSLIRGLNSGPLPFKLSTNFRFNTSMSMTNGGAPATLTKYQFRLNSLFDPDFTSATTRKPRGYNELSQIYKHVRVYLVKCIFNVTPTAGTGNNDELVFGYQFNEFLAGNINTVIDARECMGVRTFSITNQKRNRFVVWVPCHKSLGLSKEQYRTEPDVAHDLTTNPLNSAMLTVFVGSSNALTTVTAQVDATLCQYATLYDRKVLPTS